MLFPALLAGIASVGHAQESASLVITAQRPTQSDSDSMIRDQLHRASAQSVGVTRSKVRSDLNMKLGRPVRSFRIAANDDRNNRG